MHGVYDSNQSRLGAASCDFPPPLLSRLIHAAQAVSVVRIRNYNTRSTGCQCCKDSKLQLSACHAGEISNQTANHWFFYNPMA